MGYQCKDLHGYKIMNQQKLISNNESEQDVIFPLPYYQHSLHYSYNLAMGTTEGIKFSCSSRHLNL